jgi:YVTN family beta-propeller protein
MKTLRHIMLLTALAGGLVPAAARQQQPQATTTQTAAAPAKAEVKPTAPQQIVHEGIKVEFTIEPAAAGQKTVAPVAGEDATVRFRISDTATNTPLAGARPSAWMAQSEGGGAATPAQCREKVQTYMQGSLRARPDVDLNTYFILSLNSEPNISVIDPLIGFGGSKLITLVLLRSPGADWALTADRSKLFVSMPAVGQVAVVDTTTWKVVTNIETGARPTSVRLQPDEKYLWVGNDDPEASASGVTVIDVAALKVAARIATGAGRHEIAFSDDSRVAYVTNADAGTLSVVDVSKLSKVRDVKAGARPSSVAFSPLSRAAYVASEDGQITVVGGAAHEALANIAAKPGLRSVRFAPGGRYGFVPNVAESVVYVFDASTNRLVHTVPVGKAPDQVAFTDAFAYVRSAGTEEVSTIRLSTMGKEPDVVKFPGGQLAPAAEPNFLAAAEAITPSPEGNVVLIANPGDKQIYYYSEGMAAPMGNFQNYKRVPRAVKVVDRSLREESRGVYATNVRLPKAGKYTVSFLLDSPRIIHCFEAEAAPNPALREERKTALRIEYPKGLREMRLKEPYKVRFRLLDAATGEPKDGLKDVRVLFFLSPGIWQKRDWAQGVGDGFYEITVTPPESGIYMLFVEVASQGVAFRQLPYLTLHVPEATPSPAASTEQQQ